MSSFHVSFTGFSLLVALMATVAPARAQVEVRVGDRSSSFSVNPSAVEAAIYLELYGHPDTARRHIEVRVRRDHVELTGSVARDSERIIARRIVAGVAPGFGLDDRLAVNEAGPLPRIELAGNESPTKLIQRYTDILADKFPDEVLQELTLTVYRVDLPRTEAPGGHPQKRQAHVGACWVLVLEGLAPSVRDQLAFSELLLFESSTIAAVINRTYVADGYVPEYKPKVRIRVPFVDVEVGGDNGVDVNVGSLAVRTGGSYRATDDSNLLEAYMHAVRDDAALQDARLNAHVHSGVLSIEGPLTAANKMRAVALAHGIRNIRGVVDRSEFIEGRPAFYSESDLDAYLHYRLGEHAGASEFELIPVAKSGFKLQANVPTEFHAAMAMVVIADDPAISRLFAEPSFRDATSGAILSMRR